MSQMSEKMKKEQALIEHVEKFISVEPADKAVASMNDDQMIDFLKEYYLNENLVYDEEINKRTEDAVLVVEKQLESGSKPPYAPELIESMINMCKLAIMDEIVEEMNKGIGPLREQLKKFKITDHEAGLNFHMSIAGTMQKYMVALAKEMGSECKSRGLDERAFMKQALPVLSSDLGMLFEIDSFCGLKNFEKSKDKEVPNEIVLAFSKQTIDYTKLLLEGKVSEQTLVIYPSLMNHFLYIKFGVDSYQVMAKVIKLLKEENYKDHLVLFRQLLEEIWYVENGRALIFAIFQQQMMMMEQMMANGMGPGGMPEQMTPEMLEKLQKGEMPQFDPSMLEGFDPSKLDPAMLEMMQKGEMPPFDPSMFQGMGGPGMGGPGMGMDPSMLFGMDPSQMDPEARKQMEMGMALGEAARKEMSQAQLMELQKALMEGDIAKMEALMPEHIRKQMQELSKQAEQK